MTEKVVVSLSFDFYIFMHITDGCNHLSCCDLYNKSYCIQFLVSHYLLTNRYSYYVTYSQPIMPAANKGPSLMFRG